MKRDLVNKYKRDDGCCRVC